MALHPRWSALIGIALSTMWVGMAWTQQSSPPQSSVQRDDPATSGAGPTSGAPGQFNYDPPKGGSVTTDSRGVTTFHPSPSNPKADPPVGRSNQSTGANRPK